MTDQRRAMVLAVMLMLGSPVTAQLQLGEKQRAPARPTSRPIAAGTVLEVPTTRPATQSDGNSYPALQRRLAQLISEVETLRAENASLKRDLALANERYEATTRPAPPGGGSAIKNGMTRKEVMYHMRREPDRQSSSADGTVALGWTVMGEAKEHPGDYVGVQLPSKEMVFGLRNPPARQVPVGSVEVVLKDDKVIRVSVSNY